MRNRNESAGDRRIWPRLKRSDLQSLALQLRDRYLAVEQAKPRFHEAAVSAQSANRQLRESLDAFSTAVNEALAAKRPRH